MTDYYWIWFIVAGVLVILEMLMFSSYALWIAIGAGFTGIVAYFIPTLDNMYQILIFALFSVVGLLIGYKFFRSQKIFETNDNILNQRGNQYINQIYTLEENIINGRAHLKISDTLWRIECSEDLETGTKVKVVSVNGNRLKVEPL